MADVGNVPPPQPPSRRRFSIQDDILLLDAVRSTNPFGDWARWAAVTRILNEAANKTFTIRAVRDRCDLLIAQFRRDDRTNLRKSGTEEQYAEKEKLLQDVSDLAREFCHRPKVLPRQAATPSTTQAASPRLSAAAQVRAAHAIRDAAACAAYQEYVETEADHQVDENGETQSPARVLLSQMCESGDQATTQGDPTEDNAANDGACGSRDVTYVVSPPPRDANISASPPRKRRPVAGGRTPRSEVVAFLERRDRNDRILKERQLNLDERRIALDESRFALEQRKHDEEAAARAEERRLQTEEKRLLLEILSKHLKN